MPKQSKTNRDSHLDALAEHYAEKRDTTRATEVKKIKHTEAIQWVSAKHKYYLKERHGMIRTLMVPDSKVHQLLSVFGVLAWTAIIASYGRGGTYM